MPRYPRDRAELQTGLRLLFDYRVGVADPLVDAAQPTAEVPWHSAEMHRAPVNRNAVDIGGMVGVVKAGGGRRKTARHAGDGAAERSNS